LKKDFDLELDSKKNFIYQMEKEIMYVPDTLKSRRRMVMTTDFTHVISRTRKFAMNGEFVVDYKLKFC